MSHLSQRCEVGHLLLRVGDNLEIDAAGVLVHRAAYILDVGKVAELSLDAESTQCVDQECVGVAEDVTRSHHVLACLSHGEESVADGCHARADGDNVFSVGQ